MATTQITLGYPAGTKIFRESDLENTAVAVSATAAVLYLIDVDNTSNVAASYLKLWNTASGSVTVGTTAPDWICMIPPSVRRPVYIPDGISFGTALAAAVVTTAGTAGTTSPSSSVIVNLVYSN